MKKTNLNCEPPLRAFKSALANLLDLIFVPTSFMRFSHRKVSEGYFKPLSNSKSEFLQVLPYTSAALWEAGRLYGYYEIAEYLLK